MNQQEVLKKAISKLSSQNKAFAVWFLPSSDQIHLAFQNPDQLEEVDGLKNLEEKSGFVFYPFEHLSTCKGILLQPEEYFSKDSDLQDFVAGHEEEAIPELAASDENLFFIKKEDYLLECQLLIEKLKAGQADKVVYSRMVSYLLGKNRTHLVKLFLDLKRSYPKAFSYLFYSPETGCWMGASPEILVQKQEEIFVTMALAGTRLIPERRVNWPEKDRSEQKYVSDFIIRNLDELDIENYKKSRPRSYPSGKIEHIRTNFEIEALDMQGKLGEFLSLMHPTPAVCGQPQKAAKELIGETEKHKREYYAGFLGPINLENQTALFVNLRCMKIYGDKYVLFAGGGLTADSSPEQEWKETQMKSKTLLSVIEKL
jgi:isochorismate synthase